MKRRCENVEYTLPEEITRLVAPLSFKNAVRTFFSVVPRDITLETYFNVQKGYLGQLLTQFRLDASKLRGHLFKANFVNDPYCDGCKRI